MWKTKAINREALRISGSRAAYPGHLENRGMNDETGETI